MMTTPRLGGLLFLALCCACTRTPKQVDCPTGAIGAPALDRGLLILGELHGTEQAPAIALATACEAARRDGRAWIGLELPTAEQHVLDAYLAGGEEAELLRTTTWQRPLQDGRNSEAMLALLRSVRALRQQGLKLEVVSFDVALEQSGARGRDQQMASAIQSAQRDRGAAPGVVLVGNVHASRRLQLPQALAWHLAKAGVAFRNFNVATTGGTAWLSGLSAGVSTVGAMGPKPAGEHGGFTFDAPPEGFDGWWFAGTLKASPPAVRRAEGTSEDAPR